jgi:hypothetical protein
MAAAPVGEKVKWLTGFHASGSPEVASAILDRIGGAELREIASTTVRELFEARSELAAYRDGSHTV